jgi:ABC-type uncharacterized transport system substrate-binding protein
VNPNNPGLTQNVIQESLAAASRLGLEIVVVKAGTENEIESAVATAVQQRVGALIIGTDAYLNSRNRQIAFFALRHGLPTVSNTRENVVAGVLMSYGPNQTDSSRQAGVYIGRILKGEKPADLPVQQPDELLAGHQPQDREGARPRSAADAAGPRRRGDQLRRREFITLLGGVAVGWPLPARAQRPAMPLVGLLLSRSADQTILAAFHRGLKETGYIPGQNVSIEYRFAEGQYDRLPALVGDLVRRQVAVLVAAPTPAALAAKAATSTIPTVFMVGTDPVKVGLVASLARPGGNRTGVSNLSVGLAAKRLQLLHELVPNATLIAVLVNPSNPSVVESTTQDVEVASDALGLQTHILGASSERDIERAFTTLVQRKASALVVIADSFFNNQRDQLVALATYHMVPTIYELREFPTVGGLMSYGANLSDAFHQVGIYTGRILKGDKPADLPVQQAVKVELVINLRAANALGLTIPPTLLTRADEVIE